MPAPRILIIPGSLRTGSHNAKLAAVAAYEFAQAGVDVTRISLADFPLPIYDGDLQAKSGVPKHALNLKRMIGAHHGVLIVSPEYNASVPPLLKNAIDWVSRVQELHEARGDVFRDGSGRARSLRGIDRAALRHEFFAKGLLRCHDAGERKALPTMPVRVVALEPEQQGGTGPVI